MHPPAWSEFQLSPIKAIELAASKIPGAVSLAQGIPSFATPDVIREFVFEKVRAGLCDRYSLTNGLAELREEIALSLQGEQITSNPDRDIIITVGSIEAITASLLALTEPGDEVLLPSPTYTSYMGALHVARCVPRFVPLREEQNFAFDFDALQSAVTKKTKALLYSSPNNPTGTLYHEHNIRELGRFAERHNLLLIIDEVYKDFYYVQHQHFSPAQIPELRQRVVRVCSFSKAFAMTGWRVGFLATQGDIAAKILKYHDAMVTCAPVISQYAALAALRFGLPFLRECQEVLKRRRDFTVQQLDQLSQRLDYQVPQATYFVFPRIKDSVPLARQSHQLAYDILEKTGLAVVPGSAFGPSGESHLRINFGRSDEDLKEGLSRFAEYLTRAVHPGNRPLRRGILPSGQSSNRPFIRRLAVAALGAGARCYIRRNRPIVVGIVGARGKTVAKRIVTEALTLHSAARMTVLSYNTEVGLPLSVLQLSAPQRREELPRFALQLLARSLFQRRDEQYLVLEYGFSDAAEARALLEIAVPDWLIITNVSDLDPSIAASPFVEGLQTMAAAVAPTQILWPASDARVREISLLRQENAIELLGEDQVQIEGVRFRVGMEHRTESARFALGAAVHIADRIGLRREGVTTTFKLTLCEP